jgi:hypothetical protein
LQAGIIRKGTIMKRLGTVAIVMLAEELFAGDSLGYGDIVGKTRLERD